MLLYGLGLEERIGSEKPHFSFSVPVRFEKLLGSYRVLLQ